VTSTAVDHLVVAAPSLEAGAAWCEATFGVAPAPGGKHPLMGTHNRLLKVAGPEFPDAYLEIIAIDPDAPSPGRARWFGVDALDLSRGPRLLHVVARTANVEMLRWGLVNVGIDPGRPLAASRETATGTLAWRILVRDDGTLPCGGGLPTLIEWQGRHPATSMPGSGVSLTALTLRGIPDRAREVLRLARAGVRAEGRPAITATLSAPRGEVVLESHP
jgi:hypothetical protein